ncbi:MAG: malate dehydrogenase [Candidatus Aenigmarchaeota archaeon]
MISIIGAGRLGANTAFQLAKEGLDDVRLVDIVEGLPQGEALDIMECSDLEVGVSGTNDFSDIKGSKVVVVIAGLPRKPGMTREDLLHKNSDIVRSVCRNIKEHAPDAVVIVVTNPMDMMTWVAHKELGFPRGRVMGMGGQLDSQRFAYFLSKELRVAPKDVKALVMGQHGEAMIPVPSQSSLNGTPVKEKLSEEQISNSIERTKGAGIEVIKLKGGTAWAPATAISRMVKAILKDEKKVIPCSVPLDGEYGQEGLCIGVPVVLGKDGFEKVKEVELTDEEKEQFNQSCQKVKEAIQSL